MTRITFDIRTADGRETTATLARAGMETRGFTDMESYAADFIRRHERVGTIVTRRPDALSPADILLAGDSHKSSNSIKRYRR